MAAGIRSMGEQRCVSCRRRGAMRINGARTIPEALFLLLWREILSFFGNHDLQAAHVGLEDLGNRYAAVGLEIVFQKGNQHPGGRYQGVI